MTPGFCCHFTCDNSEAIFIHSAMFIKAVLWDLLGILQFPLQHGGVMLVLDLDLSFGTWFTYLCFMVDTQKQAANSGNFGVLVPKMKFKKLGFLSKLRLKIKVPLQRRNRSISYFYKKIKTLKISHREILTFLKVWL